MYQIPIPPAGLTQEVFNYLFQVQQLLNLQLQELDAAVYVTENGKTASAAQLYRRGTGVSAQTAEELKTRCVNLQKDIDAQGENALSLQQRIQTLGADLDGVSHSVQTLHDTAHALQQRVHSLHDALQSLPDTLFPVGSVYSTAVNRAPAFGSWEAAQSAAEGLYQWKRTA